VHPPVASLPESKKLRILVTGGSGFVGSHLVDRLMMQGHIVTVIDNMFTGRKRNVIQWIGHPNFNLMVHDVVEPIFLELDQIYHLACPASPPHYQYNPIKTIKTSTEGTLNMLGLAKRVKVYSYSHFYFCYQIEKFVRYKRLILTKLLHRRACCSPQPLRSMAIQKCIHSMNPTGDM
jgi:UDP-glucose 4-epimerase